LKNEGKEAAAVGIFLVLIFSVPWLSEWWFGSPVRTVSTVQEQIAYNDSIQAAETPEPPYLLADCYDGIVEIQFEVKERGELRIRIYNEIGALVKEYAYSDVKLGPRQVRWLPMKEGPHTVFLNHSSCRLTASVEVTR
jgi:hypothetical protein